MAAAKNIQRPHSLEWKDDYDVIPASNITHINVENMSFALNLRRSDAAPPLNSPGKDRVALLEKAKRMREKATSSKAEDTSMPAVAMGQLVRDNGCKNSACKQVVADVFAVLEDSQELRNQIQELSYSVNDENEILATLTKEFDGINDIQQTLLKSLSQLDVDVDRIQRKYQEITNERRELEMQIMEANDLMRKTIMKKSGIKEESTDLLETTEDNAKKVKTKPKKKHNGHYDMYDGKNQWSCCLAEKEDAMGCIDNDSVGGMTILAQIKNPFRNHTKVAPLRAESYRNSRKHHIIRYPMTSVDNLSFEFEDFNNRETTPVEALKVSIELPPKPKSSKPRPQTAHAQTTASATTTMMNRSNTQHNPLSSSTSSAAPHPSSFQPFNSFFTSASAEGSQQHGQSLFQKSHHQPHHNSHNQNNNNMRPVSASPTMRRPMSANPHMSVSHSTHHTHHNHHSHSHDHHQHHHQHNHHHASTTSFAKSIYNGSTVLDTRPKIMPENTLLGSFRDHKVGKVRSVATSEGHLQRKNRPMSSPAGYGLYREYQVQHHHPSFMPQTLLGTTSILEVSGYK